MIRIDSLPLQTYPQAIGAVTPLIDQGKIAEANESLQAALNTVVVTEHVLPLPLLRVEEKLTKAEDLAQKDGPSEEDSKTLAILVEEARPQLKLAEALGYGTKQDYKKFDAEIETIEEKTKEGRGAKGVFGTLREYLRTEANYFSLRISHFEEESRLRALLNIRVVSRVESWADTVAESQ